MNPAIGPATPMSKTARREGIGETILINAPSVPAGPIMNHVQALSDPQTLARDARELARTLPASVVVVASTPRLDVLELRTMTGVEPAVVRLAISAGEPSNDDVAEATAALLTGE